MTELLILLVLMWLFRKWFTDLTPEDYEDIVVMSLDGDEKE